VGFSLAYAFCKCERHRKKWPPGGGSNGASQMSRRFRNKVLACLGFLACALALPAFCGPMGFKESWMVMGDFSPHWQEAFVNYALTPRDALGASTLYMRSDDERKSRQLEDVTYTPIA